MTHPACRKCLPLANSMDVQHFDSLRHKWVATDDSWISREMGLDIWQHRRCSFPLFKQVQEDTSDSLHYLLVSSTVKYLWTDSLMSLYCAHFRFLPEATTVRTNMVLLLRAVSDILDHQDRMLKHLPISASLLCLQALYFRQSWYRMVIYGILF
jgi:hypothetical protein